MISALLKKNYLAQTQFVLGFFSPKPRSDTLIHSYSSPNWPCSCNQFHNSWSSIWLLRICLSSLYCLSLSLVFHQLVKSQSHARMLLFGLEFKWRLNLTWCLQAFWRTYWSILICTHPVRLSIRIVVFFLYGFFAVSSFRTWSNRFLTVYWLHQWCVSWERKIRSEAIFVAKASSKDVVSVHRFFSHFPQVHC